MSDELDLAGLDDYEPDNVVCPFDGCTDEFDMNAFRWEAGSNPDLPDCVEVIE